MAESSGENRKAAIIAAATKVFYEKGYDDTYLEDIAESIGISKQLVAYHYETKANLARKVQNAFTLRNTVHIREKLEGTYPNHRFFDPYLFSVIALILNFRLERADTNVLRFVIRVLPEAYISQTEELSIGLLHFVNPSGKALDNESALKYALAATAYQGIHSSVRNAYVNSLLPCSYQAVSDYLVEMFLKLMDVPSERSRLLLRNASEILEEVPFSLDPYFQIN